MKRIVSYNLNGIRSALNKGLLEWFNDLRPDVLCIQETKAQEDQLTHEQFKPDDYYCHYHDAVKKGYSGVATLSKPTPTNQSKGFGVDHFDREGRRINVISN